MLCKYINLGIKAKSPLFIPLILHSSYVSCPHPLPFSTSRKQVKDEGKERGKQERKTAALQRYSLHHRALLPGWRQWHAEQMSYSNYYINTHPCSHTKHTLCPAGAWARHCSLSYSPEAEAWRRMFWCGRTVSVTDLRQMLRGVPALLKQGQLCVS